MEIHWEESETGGYASYTNEQGDTAKSTFSKAGSHQLIIDHTEVPDSMRGMGVGLKLVQRIIDHSRRNNIKIIPLCPFARSVFQKYPEYRDVLRH